MRAVGRVNVAGMMGYWYWIAQNGNRLRWNPQPIEVFSSGPRSPPADGEAAIPKDDQFPIGVALSFQAIE